MRLDISDRLQRIEEMVRDAKAMPLSSSVLLGRDDLLEALAAARAELPDEITQARRITGARDDLLAKARRDGEALVEEGRKEQAHLVSLEGVVLAANREAAEVLERAREEARQMRLETEDYVDAKLAQFEVALERTGRDVERSLSQVRRGREKLQGAPAPGGEATAPAEAAEASEGDGP